MFFRKESLLTKPILLFIIILIIGLLFVIHPIRGILKKAGDKLVLAVQIAKLKVINSKMQNSYRVAQGLLLSRTWEGKFAMYKNPKTAKYFGAEGINTKLLLKAQQISDKYNIKLKSRYILLPYFFKEKEGIVTLGFLPFDCAGISFASDAKRQKENN